IKLQHFTSLIFLSLTHTSNYDLCLPRPGSGYQRLRWLPPQRLRLWPRNRLLRTEWIRLCPRRQVLRDRLPRCPSRRYIRRRCSRQGRQLPRCS
ncbi:unnamed protein product, partial [Ixodes pacificus]